MITIYYNIRRIYLNETIIIDLLSGVPIRNKRMFCGNRWLPEYDSILLYYIESDVIMLTI